MTFSQMKAILELNHISDDVVIMSNSGWECGATAVEAIYYSDSKKEIHLVPDVSYPGYEYDEDMLMDDEKKAHDWVRLKAI